MMLKTILLYPISRIYFPEDSRHASWIDGTHVDKTKGLNHVKRGVFVFQKMGSFQVAFIGFPTGVDFQQTDLGGFFLLIHGINTDHSRLKSDRSLCFFFENGKILIQMLGGDFEFGDANHGATFWRLCQSKMREKQQGQAKQVFHGVSLSVWEKLLHYFLIADFNIQLKFAAKTKFNDFL